MNFKYLWFQLFILVDCLHYPNGCYNGSFRDVVTLLLGSLLSLVVPMVLLISTSTAIFFKSITTDPVSLVTM